MCLRFWLCFVLQENQLQRCKYLAPFFIKVHIQNRAQLYDRTDCVMLCAFFLLLKLFYNITLNALF